MNLKTNLFAIPFLSFIPTKYKKIIKESGGKLFLVVLIIILIRVILSGIAINHAIEDMCDDAPQFTLIHNELSINDDILVSDDDTYIQISSKIDSYDEKTFKELAYSSNYRTILILTKTNVCIKSTNGISIANYNQLNLEAIFNTSVINNDTIKDLLKPYIPIICVVYFIVLVFSYFVACLLLWLLTIIACAITGVVMPAGEQFKLTIITKMPVYIITFLCFLYLPVSIPWYVGVIAIFIFMLVGLRIINESSMNINSNSFVNTLTDDTDKYNNNF